MGVPKYFRWLSERYPMIMQLVEENKIPEFDNLSHPRDDEATFRITEEDIFLGIFGYIEHLFSKIRPRKVFFLAIDGVAPRAKMNQQRSRRFRTAQEAKENVEKAVRRGEKLPDSDPFDSNCITPGTVFMHKLQHQLEYFIAKKVSEDTNWRDVHVILSGHNTPGEGEHKIMEYIRTTKAQPGYNPNTRHCLYGLDADLIMLGLLTHDPHFALLREEVVFGPQRTKKNSALEHQTFYLLHISLLREYLALEFDALREKLPFAFDLEKIIDDYILLHLFVGNDFLPHLPGLHINEGAIQLLFDIYRKVLPSAGGYLNEQGILQPARLQLILRELFGLERNNFVRDHMPDLDQKKQPKKRARKKEKQAMHITPRQRDWVTQIHTFITAYDAAPDAAPSETKFPANLDAKDAEFLAGLANALGLSMVNNEYDPVEDVTNTLVTIDKQKIPRDDGMAHDEAFPMERQHAVRQVLAPYLGARVDGAADKTEDTEQETEVGEDEEQVESCMREEKIDRSLVAWKAHYYKSKLEMAYTPENIHDLVFNYIEGFQWVLHYYYEGNASWGWFYRYHYAPQVSDLDKIAEFRFDFVRGTPFLPFEQLMGVLPPLSRKLIPGAMQELMTDPTSPILDFYPMDFEADLNGKKNSWEAVVKIPFIDEQRLLAAMQLRAGGLSEEEKQRNTHGPPKSFKFDAMFTHVYPSSLPGFFPDLHENHVRVELYELPSMEGRSYLKTLPEGVMVGADAMPGFPTLWTLPFAHKLANFGVNVHGSVSSAPTMVITIQPVAAPALEQLAQTAIGAPTFTGWPFLFEGIVAGVSDPTYHYAAALDKDKAVHIKRLRSENEGPDAYKRQVEKVRSHYAKRYGVVIGNTPALLHVRPLRGLHRLPNGAIVKDYESEHRAEICYPLQLMVANVTHQDTRFLERPGLSIGSEFPDGTKVFYLGDPGFGCPARVIGTTSKSVAVELAFLTDLAQENMLLRKLVRERAHEPYYAAAKVAAGLRVNSLAFAKLTSSVVISSSNTKINIGLNLKFEAKGRKVLGYTQRGLYGWEYSDKAIQLIQDFVEKFPQVPKALARPPRDGEYYQASEIFVQDTDARIKELRAYLKKNVCDLEDVPLYAEQLPRTLIATLETAVLVLAKKRSEADGPSVRRQILRDLPRQALLKPEQAQYRVPEQSYELGDRVVNVLDFGAIPLGAKGTVIGIGTDAIDVVFDAPFLAGNTLGGACSNYRGATVGRAHVLNLTVPQLATKWGNEMDATEETTPIARTLLSSKPPSNKPTAPPNRPKNFFDAAPARHAKPGIGARAQTSKGVHAVAQHLETLSIHAQRSRVQKPKQAPSSVWQRRERGAGKPRE
ncbi:hypothetical protein MVES_001427 [Malassezia vespertilionis]|uniref:5'-3' exoribonuclease 1 n=1 Tax=Malassezia vespertilionis TaxID=2020962 RepID=A0A2N1JCK3_9BASI|nr:hypothetical protein MVES_001427 [Malassezia vespertilionis]